MTRAATNVLEHRFPGRLVALRLLAQVEHVLATVQALLRRRHQHRQLGRIMRGPDMLQDPALPVPLLDDLDSRRPGGGLHLAHERAHQATLQSAS
jgi:hypothetical protein